MLWTCNHDNSSACLYYTIYKWKEKLRKKIKLQDNADTTAIHKEMSAFFLINLIKNNDCFLAYVFKCHPIICQRWLLWNSFDYNLCHKQYQIRFPAFRDVSKILKVSLALFIIVLSISWQFLEPYPSENNGKLHNRYNHLDLNDLYDLASICPI